MPEPTLKELLAVAADIAYMAGRRTLAYFNNGVAVEDKADDTPVTIADKEAERLIREQVARYYPTHAILGEEQGETAGDKRYKWIIDPIDGTKSFIHGVPMYGTLIGIEVDGRPRVGAAYLPATDEMVLAAEGHGCTHNGRRARVSSISQLNQATLLTSSFVTCAERSDAFEKLAAQARLVRGWGDCYGYLMLATARADIMLDPKLNPWDCAALMLIITEAGGRFSSWNGEVSIYGGDGVACNAALYDTVIQVLRNEKRRGH